MDMPEASDRPEAPTNIGPKIARTNVAHRLRTWRDRAGLSIAAVADHMDWSVSKLTRVENGEVSVQPLEVRALLTRYGVTDENEIGQLSQLALISRTPQWYSNHRLTGAFAEFVAYEHEASVIQAWQLLFIPGLLQTREYASAITARTLRTSVNDEQTQARVQLRMDRKQALLERMNEPSAPSMIAVIDESVLRRPVGGHDVMAGQLDHLLDLAQDAERVVLGVVPLDLDPHSGLGGCFEILHFPGQSHQDVLFVEGAAGADFLLTDAKMTERHNLLFNDLLSHGKTGDNALRMIQSIRDEMHRN